MRVFVVTNDELGWDNVVGVFSSQQMAADHLDMTITELYEYPYHLHDEELI